MSTLCVIPARGGSKRIPRKNVRSFAGKPIIVWSIEAARATGVFDAIVVSTDDDEIAEIAVAAGADVPFRRPPELSNDHTPTIPVIRHALDWFDENRTPVSVACCVYATAPFLQPQFLLEGRKVLLADPTVEFAFSVTSYAFPIFRALKVSARGTVEMFWPENEVRRSQDLPQAFHDAGQFYWGTPEAFRRCQGFFSATSRPIILPRNLVQDIDTTEDWDIAEQMFRFSQERSSSEVTRRER
jgi:pseudaminic acid cytidylyltransferase